MSRPPIGTSQRSFQTRIIRHSRLRLRLVVSFRFFIAAISARGLETFQLPPALESG